MPVKELSTGGKKADHTLDGQSWLTMAGAVKKQAGPDSFVVNGMALVRQQGSVLLIAVNEEKAAVTAEITAARQRIAEIFADLYHYELKWTAWQQGLNSYAMLKAAERKRQQDEAMTLLSNDSHAQEIKKIFQGEWDITDAYKQD